MFWGLAECTAVRILARHSRTVLFYVENWWEAYKTVSLLFVPIYIIKSNKSGVELKG